MSFGESKRAYQMIEQGKRKEVDEPLHINGLTIKEVAESNHYTYLGANGSVGIDAPLNKDRVTRDYKRRVRKVWNSELKWYNKSIVHNTFAVAVLLSTFGILDWNKEEIKNLTVATRKIMTVSGSFHKVSDVNQFYADRKKAGRGLKNIEDSFAAAVIGLAEYLEGRRTKEETTLMDKVNDNEQERIIRLEKEFRKQVPHVKGEGKDAMRDAMKKEHEQKWKEKETHGYLGKQLEDNNYVDNILTNNWLQQCLSSDIEGFVMAIQEQELL